MSYDVRFIESDYFEVRDRPAFEAWIRTTTAEDVALNLLWEDERVMLNMVEGEMSGLRFLDQDGEEVDTDAFLKGLCGHLSVGQSACIIAMGFTRGRNSIAYSWATKWRITPDEPETLANISL
jgi:hypothetical protein